MDNQHRRISGYRELSQDEIDLMNEIKAAGPMLDAIVEKVRKHVDTQRTAAQVSDDEAARLDGAQPERWTALARTDLQRGLMALTRAVAQPTFF